MQNKAPWTAAEIELAKRLFADAERAGTLKPPRVLAVVGYRSRPGTTTSWSPTDWRRYLSDARKQLTNNR